MIKPFLSSYIEIAQLKGKLRIQPKVSQLLTLILAESALERIPKEISRHSSLQRRSRFLRKRPSELVLDRSYHHRAMLSLQDADKRGRPDIVHFCLLNALGTPLNKEHMLRVYVHTLNNEVISVAPEVRLPRNYSRFISLVEQLYQTHHVPTEGKTLMEIQAETLQNLLRRLRPSRVVALSVNGEKSTAEKAIKPLVSEENPAILIGGFPRGHFSAQVTQLADTTISIDPEGLDTWIVVSRLLYEFEKQSNISDRRWIQRPEEKQDHNRSDGQEEV